jgi:hypothetical protein
LPRASCFWIELSKGAARTTIYCRKSESRLRSPMNNPALPHGPRPQAPVVALLRRKRVREIFFRLKAG